MNVGRINGRMRLVSALAYCDVIKYLELDTDTKIARIQTASLISAVMRAKR
jgi:hypothetical protein